MKSMIRSLPMTAVLFLVGASGAPAQFQIDWHTIDGGGVMNSTDGQPNGFVLSGTVGQADSGPHPLSMTGGGFDLTGGFWVVGLGCTCPGDMNHDGLKNGRDVHRFAACIVASTGDCSCAEVDGLGGLTISDVTVFVADLLAGDACS